ncbi:MAG: tRNA guanosine(15) transglycosylase TgtA [Promethearchaeota archaeon]
MDVDALGRIGKLKLMEKEMITPNLFPVVHPIKNIISPSDLIKMGSQCIFTNAYIIYQNKEIKEQVLKKGIHQYLNFNGIVATDSGAFQQYIYNDDKLDISADEIEKFQEKLNTDFAVILDIPVQLSDDFEMAKSKVLKTIERAKQNVNRRRSKNCNWFGPIHGARYLDLIELSTKEMSKLNYDVYAIGGLVKTFLDYRFDIAIQNLLIVKEYLIPNRPIHMFGLGLPQFFSLAVACGCDLMDSAAYILYAKEDRYFTLSTGTKTLEELYEFPCHCPVCSKYKPQEMKSFNEELKTELLAKHNLYLSFSELRTIRQAIREGNLWELVDLRIRNHPNLVNAVKLIKDHKALFEIHEKIYKSHGRLYSSNEALNRPLIYRYKKRLLTNFRVPKDAKYLIILPELDTKVNNSTTTQKWLEKINKNKIIPRELIHIVFISEFYGLIPLELIESFPMGQYESIKSSGINDLIHSYSLRKVEQFLNKNNKFYIKCAVLIPENYVNQFNEVVDFPKDNIIYSLISVLKSNFKERFFEFKNLEEILMFFTNDD